MPQVAAELILRAADEGAAVDPDDDREGGFGCRGRAGQIDVEFAVGVGVVAQVERREDVLGRVGELLGGALHGRSANRRRMAWAAGRGENQRLIRSASTLSAIMNRCQPDGSGIRAIAPPMVHLPVFSLLRKLGKVQGRAAPTPVAHTVRLSGCPGVAGASGCSAAW